LNIEISKTKSAVVVFEGFAVFLIIHSIGGYYFAQKLSAIYPDVPCLIVSIASSSAISPVIAILYLSLRLKFVPGFALNKKIFLYAIVGIILAWIVIFIKILFIGKESLFSQEILKTPYPYYYFMLFFVLVWGPILEETLTRGYFFEILRRQWGEVVALFISSFLFLVPHAIWGTIGVELFFILLYSIIFTLTYMQGGLIASILVHAFVNFYLFYLNIDI